MSQATPQEEEEEEEEEEERRRRTVCDSSYPDLCISRLTPHLYCCDDSVIENFQPLPPDPHEFHLDSDGIGCDSVSNEAVVEQESPNNDSGTTVGGTSLADDDKNVTAETMMTHRRKAKCF